MSMEVVYRTTDMASLGTISEMTGIFWWRRAWLNRYQKSAQKPAVENISQNKTTNNKKVSCQIKPTASIAPARSQKEENRSQREAKKQRNLHVLLLYYTNVEVLHRTFNWSPYLLLI